MPTFSELVTNVKGRTNLTNESSYDVLIRTWINDAQQDIASRYLWSFLRTTDEITTVASQSQYELTVEGIIYNMRDVDNDTSLTYVDDLDFDKSQPNPTQTGIPTTYRVFDYIQNDPSLPAYPQFELYPIPDAAYSVISKVFVRPPDLSGDDDVSIFPKVFHRLLVHYAANVVFSARNDVRAIEQKDLYESGLADCVNQFSAVPVDRIETLRSIDDSTTSGRVRLPAGFGPVVF